MTYDNAKGALIIAANTADAVREMRGHDNLAAYWRDEYDLAIAERNRLLAKLIRAENEIEELKRKLAEGHNER